MFSFKNSKGRTYYLHSRVTELKNGHVQTIYYFSKAKEGALTEVPAGKEAVETVRGLPVLRNKQA